jgi:NAD+ synthase (glutamine-hydrolysing)
MWSKLLHTWGDRLSPQQIYEKVRFFFWCYGINRHKMTTLTPSYHAEQYGPDDNRLVFSPSHFAQRVLAVEGRRSKISYKNE